MLAQARGQRAVGRKSAAASGLLPVADRVIFREKSRVDMILSGARQRLFDRWRCFFAWVNDLIRFFRRGGVDF
jgi:hypothetical protein